MGERASYPEHDSTYRAGKSDFEMFVEHINAAMAERVDDTIPELPIKDLVSPFFLSIFSFHFFFFFFFFFKKKGISFRGHCR